MPFERFKFSRISKITPIIPPPPPTVTPPIIEPPTPPIITDILVTNYGFLDYPLIPIYLNIDQQYVYTVFGVTYTSTDLETAMRVIRSILEGHVTPPPPPPPPPPPITTPFRSINQAQIYEESDISNIGAYRIAICNELSKSKHNAIKSLNPSIKTYFYLNFMSGANAKSYTLSDSQGKNIIGDGLYAYDPGSPAFLEYLKTRTLEAEQKGYDGIFCDNQPRAIYPIPYPFKVRAINPRTGRTYTDNEYSNDSLNLVTQCRSILPVIGNGIPSALEYLANKSRYDYLVTHQDGVMLEGPVGWSQKDLDSRPVDLFQANLDLAVNLSNSCDMVLFSNTGSSDMETSNTAQFVFFSYMLIAKPNISLKFRGLTYMNGGFWKNLQSLDLGLPLGAYNREGTNFTRFFEKGSVMLDYAGKSSRFVAG